MTRTRHGSPPQRPRPWQRLLTRWSREICAPYRTYRDGGGEGRGGEQCHRFESGVCCTRCIVAVTAADRCLLHLAQKLIAVAQEACDMLPSTITLFSPVTLLHQCTKRKKVNLLTAAKHRPTSRHYSCNLPVAVLYIYRCTPLGWVCVNVGGTG